MRLALLTFHRANNCGAMLQAWALKYVLEGFGHRVLLPNSNHAGTTKRWRLRAPLRNKPLAQVFQDLLLWPVWELFAFGVEDLKRLRYSFFSRRYLRPSPAMTASQMAACCDAAIIGSDQVWNPKCIQREKDIRWCFGEDLPDDFPRLSYTASIGDGQLSDCHFRRLQSAASKYSRLLVREEFAGVGLLDRCGNGATVVLDPSFLVLRKEYEKIAYPHRLVSKKYLVVYIVSDVMDGFYEQVEELANAMNLEVVFLPAYAHGRFRVPPHSVVAFSPDRFLAYIRDAECVIACSFHGAAFSLVYEKPFVALLSQSAAQQSRVASLLKSLGLENRIVTKDVNVGLVQAKLEQPLPMEVFQKLSELGLRSRRLLRASIEELKARDQNE